MLKTLFHVYSNYFPREMTINAARGDMHKYVVVVFYFVCFGVFCYFMDKNNSIKYTTHHICILWQISYSAFPTFTNKVVWSNASFTVHRQSLYLSEQFSRNRFGIPRTTMFNTRDMRDGCVGIPNLSRFHIL